MRSRACSFHCVLLLLCIFGSSRAADGVTHVGDQWALENPRLQVTIDARSGRIEVLDKVNGHEWQQPPGARSGALSHVRSLEDSRHGIAFDYTAWLGKDRPLKLVVTLTLAEQLPDVEVTADASDHETEATNFPFLDPFVLDAPTAVLAVADYCNGHIYPLNAEPFPATWFAASRLDMPWFGVCDLATGQGYAVIIETSDDAYVQMVRHERDGKSYFAPRVGWSPSCRKFAYPRRLLYHFASEGGYVALAKRYRQYAKTQGLIVSLNEKQKANPSVARLYGAPDVWGNASLAFARQAKQAGVEKMLIHGRASPDDMRAINELGYLTSEYDNYTDVLPLEPGQGIDRQHDKIPASVVLQEDGTRMKAWLTFDKKQQFMKRCPSLWVDAAKATIPEVLSQRPFLGRFIDVTTAEDLYECYDPTHPLSRANKRECGVQLLSYVQSLGLVTGGEHGVWWAVPQLDYIEGMMSANPYFSWPAGHLKHPRTKDEAFTSPWGQKLPSWDTYARWGIGHENRVPLWELVFHDCVVSTWYWGDSSDWLLDAAPEITAKKDAFNILYGTIPMLWANREGLWRQDRALFLRTYRNTCKLHEAVAGTELLSHEFVTPDRSIQRTRFSDGTVVVVNFGTEPYTAQIDGRTYVLPQNGFAVQGPRIEQSLELVDGQPVTRIQAGS